MPPIYAVLSQSGKAIIKTYKTRDAAMAKAREGVTTLRVVEYRPYAIAGYSIKKK